MKVEAYVNLHKTRAAGRTVYSVRDATTRRVIAHTSFLVLKDAELVVGRKGRERVLREKRKNVHAFVRGHIADQVRGLLEEVPVRYNPYEGPTFVERATGAEIHGGPYIEMTSGGCYAWR